MLELSLACQDVDRNRPIIDGRVGVEGCRLNLLVARPEEIFQRAFRHREFDISEGSPAYEGSANGGSDLPISTPAS